MHCIDCNGVGGVIIGSVLVILVRSHVALGPNQQARLDVLNEKRKQWYSDNEVRTRMPDMKLTWLWSAE